MFRTNRLRLGLVGRGILFSGIGIEVGEGLEGILNVRCLGDDIS